MDASASSKKGDCDVKEVASYYIEIEKGFPTAAKQRNTVVKYTKLPDFDDVINPKASWSHGSYCLRPRLRRIITLEEPKHTSSRSLKPDLTHPIKTMSQNSTKRKIVTINEDDENQLYPRYSSKLRPNYNKTTSRSVVADFKDQHKPPKPSSCSIKKTYSKDIQTSAKQPNRNQSGSNIIPKTSYNNYKNRNAKTVLDTTKSRIKEKESPRSNKNITFSKSNISNKSFVTASESEREISGIKSKLYENLKYIPSNKRFTEKARSNKSPLPTKSKASIMKKVLIKSAPLTVIHVPLEPKYLKIKENVKTDSSTTFPSTTDDGRTKENATNMGITFKDMSIGTEPRPQTVDQVTEMSNSENSVYYKCMQSTNVQTEVIKETFDSLHVPNVTLTKDRNESKVEYLHSQSLPNLQMPSFKITPNKNDNSSFVSNFRKSTSFIIGRGTLTYTTKQKINFEVVGSKASSNYSNHAPSPLSYPMNVVSVFQKEMKKDLIENNCNARGGERKDNEDESDSSRNTQKSLDCSYVSDSNKLMKPSDIISTIRLNNGLSQSDYICEQFQRELNFIDSFFESLQYLESCSLTDTYLNCDKIGNFVENSTFLDSDLNLQISDYGTLISKLDDGDTVSDSQTMATKNLFLLNLLIRDEQSRANNLLFVLKKREEALKDFTKSQILYLENKKKNYNQDFSVLQKKQRGALLKLQHECGEMQRMRKALLTLSEKRKVALMRTKKDLELKLKNNVDVKQIILGKKKLKRNASIERASPLKCFDLSSSGCEDSTTSRATPETSLLSPPAQPQPQTVVSSAEKSIQTGDSILVPPVESAIAIATADENFVTVDGSYLNILFTNLSLPQIFSGRKQYEVNEEALKNIVNSPNQQDFKQLDVDKLMNNIKNESEMSSSPSTARSLVEELDQYYRGLREEEEREAAEAKLAPAITITTIVEEKEVVTKNASEVTLHASEVESNAQSCDETVLGLDREECTAAGPLPVPPGAPDPQPVPALPAPSTLSSSSNTDSSSYTSQSLCELVSSISSLAAPVQCEAEELRRQQLAIEKEIKELKQQQCRLLVVREIPDKPPPPYTPPVDTKPTTPKVFALNDETLDSVNKYVGKTPPSGTDAFDLFLHDFCAETMERCMGQEQSDKPWDAVNLMPPAPVFDRDKLTAHTTHHLKDVLVGPTPTLLSGVSSRRSDHIDDILFAEWRRVEPAWTTLHSDEAQVKNQIFESIFQKILTQTVDEYKRTVLCDD